MIGEELIMPSVRDVIETVMKEDSSSVLKYLSLSNSTVQRHIDVMTLDVEKTRFRIKRMQICNSDGRVDF